MSAVLSTAMPGQLAGTRPKIHRLPAAMARPPVKKFPETLSFMVPYFVGGMVMAALIAIGVASQAPEKTDEIMAEATLVPQISITPQEAATEQAVAQPVTPDVAKPTTLAMNDTQAVALSKLPPSSAAHLTMNDASTGKTIVLQGQNDAIIGQMARIPTTNEQIVEIKSPQDVDNSAGRELLSILNKY